MFNFNFHFILILTVVCTPTATDEQTCDIKDKSAKAMCKVIEKTFPQDNGKFSKYCCSCLTALIKTQPALCDAKDYDFSPAPKCGQVFKSKEFAKISSKDNLFITFLTNNLLGKVFNLCTESEDKVVQAARVIYQPGWVSNAIDHVILQSFKSKMGQTMSDCYHQVLELASENKE